MNDLPLFDAAEARKRRDDGMKIVIDHNLPWAAQAMAMIEKLRDEFSDFTGEQMRIHIEAMIGQPGHPGAWGAIFVAAIKRGLIVPTGEWRPMQTPESHARKTPVYRSAA